MIFRFLSTKNRQRTQRAYTTCQLHSCETRGGKRQGKGRSSSGISMDMIVPIQSLYSKYLLLLLLLIVLQVDVRGMRFGYKGTNL